MGDSEPVIEEGAAVLLVDRAGRILLQQRDDDIPPAGYGRWAFAGGHREPGETPEETAFRELEEETGLRISHIRLFGTFDRPGVADPTKTHRMHIFFSSDEVDEGAIVVNEGLDFRFKSAAEIGTLPMNEFPRETLASFLASDYYRGIVEAGAEHTEGVAVLALDRWGRVLLQLRDADLPPDRFPGQWSLAGGYVAADESPDAAALREFEEETGHLLEDLKLYRVYRRDELPPQLVDVQHVYFADPDIPEDEIEVNEGQAFRYYRPDEIEGLEIPPHARHILEQFFLSGSYKALFH